MCDDRTAVIVSAGTELTEGITQDTHVRFLASELSSIGFRLLRGLQIPDDPAIFRHELSRAISDACLVIVTGGLGPTTDDLTRETIAEAAGVPLDFHPEAWEAIQARFKGRTLSETNRKQALAPHGFTLLPNPNGTAPGFWGTIGESLVVALPGPPSELRPMYANEALPVLRDRFGAPAAGDILWATALMVPESNLEEALRTCARVGVAWGTRVEEDRISFSLRGGSPDAREEFYSAIESLLGSARIRRGETRPSLLLTEALLSRKLMLVTAESCTGGLIGKYMTDLPGSSRVFWGGLLTYADEAKSMLASVDPVILTEHGAVSEETVRAMAQGALARSAADVAVAVSGIAGPDGGTAEKPVGTVWTAVAHRGGSCATRLWNFSGSRDMIRRRTAVAAMLFAEAQILGRPAMHDSGNLRGPGGSRLS
ncbi:MAG TPA: CinA family nicotinamide mononucleotide deamidase-related protein [Spirochaetia bacterium]